MDYFENLPKLAIGFLLTALFFVVGILILTSIGNNSQFYTLTTATNETFTMPSQNGSITTSEGYVVSVTSVKNASGIEYSSTNYTVTGTGYSLGATITFTENTTACKTGQTCRVTYTYNNHDTTTGTVVVKATEALEEIPNNWLLLIVVVLAASIIIGIVMNEFPKNR